MKKTAILLFTIIIIFSGCTKEELTLESFPVSSVRITKGPFYNAQQVDIKYMLALDPDRLLAPYLREAGITPLKPNYGNWESTGLDGHIGGHYLSALSFMYAATGMDTLLQRLNYMIEWLDTCQQANGNGYVGGVPGSKEVWDEISKGEIHAGAFSLNNRWVPLYNIHKIYAGLNDVYVNTGNKKALDMLVKLTDWMIETTKNLSDEQIQEMLISEHGGLNEVFVDVYNHTGEQKYLELARKFSHNEILEPLEKNENKLTGLHANTQIPKVIGYKKYADAAQNKEWDEASKFFWNTVIDDWTISIGGNSVREHFHPADDFSSMVESNQGPETCNTYNMLRLTKLLELSDPQQKYMDYYERALFNHILSTEHPDKGGFVYFTPMRPRHYRVYSQPQKGFWCCVGSGLENPGRYGEMIYTHTESDIYVNLFINSELTWKEKGISLTQETNFPYSETTMLKMKLDESAKFAVNIRKPGWADVVEIKVNGEKQNVAVDDNPYFSIKRKWTTGDIVEITLPMKTTIEFLPDGSHWASFVHGPIVLGAATDSADLDGLFADDSRMGHVANGKFYPMKDAPVIITNPENMESNLSLVKGKPLHYNLQYKVYPDKYKSVELQPFFEIHEARYMVYWPVSTEEELEGKLKEIEAKEKEKLALEAITIDYVAPGEQQPETEHNFKGNNTWTGIQKDVHWRSGAGWFSYTLKNKKQKGKKVRITLWGEDNNTEFTISLNNTVLDTVVQDGSKGNDFYVVEYKVPNEIINTAIYTIKFQAINEKFMGRVFDVRLVE